MEENKEFGHILEWTYDDVQRWISKIFKNIKFNCDELFILSIVINVDGRGLLILRNDDIMAGMKNYPHYKYALRIKSVFNHELRKLQLANIDVIKSLGYNPEYIIPGLIKEKSDYIICDSSHRMSSAISNAEERPKDGTATNLKPEFGKTLISIASKKAGKQGFLHPIDKGDVPLHTYHIDHLGPLTTTDKNYQHIFVVMDAFSKFVWLYPTKSTYCREAISKLEQQKQVFGSPVRIISNKGTAFTSDEFNEYCQEEGIEHLKVMTGLPRANGQVERLNRTVTSLISKLAIDEPAKWFKFVSDVQMLINSTYNRSIGRTPFQVMFGLKLRSKGFPLKELSAMEIVNDLEEYRKGIPVDAKTDFEDPRGKQEEQ